MKRKVFSAVLSFLLLLTAASVAESPLAYTFAHDGVVFQAFLLPDGDILYYGSFGRQASDGRYADSVIRAKPDGTEVWAFDMPYPENELGIYSYFLPLSDGRYMLTHALGEDDLCAFFIDAENGVTGKQLPYGEQHYFAVDGGVIAVDAVGADSVRLYWLGLNGQEKSYKDYDLDRAREMDFELLDTGDTLYLLGQDWASSDKGIYSVTKLTKDGALQWQKTYDLLPYGYVYVFQPDGEGGVLLIGEAATLQNDDYTNTTVARRMSPDGDIIWEKEIDVGEWIVRWERPVDDGVLMIWETDDTFRFVTLARDGELTAGPVLEKPNTGMEDMQCWVGGYVTDEVGREWVYYNTIREIDMYQTEVKPHIEPLEAFTAREEGT